MALIKKYGHPDLKIELHRFKNGYQIQHKEWIRDQESWVKTVVRGPFRGLDRASNQCAEDVRDAICDGYSMECLFHRPSR